MLGRHKNNWNIMLFLELWAYHTSTNIATGFTPFQLVYGLEVVLSIECEISSLNIVVELFPNTFVDEECLLYLASLDEQHCDSTLANEAHKKQVKSKYGKSTCPPVFSKGDLVLVYDQDHDTLGVGKFESIWHVSTSLNMSRK
jgi:hypothetical protein